MDKSVEETTGVVSRARALLSSLSAFAAISEVMKRYPDVDVHLAGGAVRDLVLERDELEDLDFFLVGDPFDDFLEALENHGAMSANPFGTPRWYPDGAGQAHCDVIPVSRFRNGLWPCHDIVDALNQFDFTGNALAVDLRSGRLHDPQNGLRDMQHRVMKMVRFDYPDEPITREHSLSRLTVLWFRILHYAAALELDIEPITQRWLIENGTRARHQEAFAQLFFTPDLTSWSALEARTNE